MPDGISSVSKVKVARPAIRPGARLPKQEHGILGYRWRGLFAASVFVVIFATQGCASVPAKADNALAELTLLQRDYQAQVNMDERPACDSDTDEVEPLPADGDDYAGREYELADQITRYLNDHCFPLVRATGDSVDTEIIIYGFVASDPCKRSAEAIADALLANTPVRIRDAALVRPEMLSTVANSNADAGFDRLD